LRTQTHARWLAITMFVANCTGCAGQIKEISAEAPRVAVPVTVDEMLKAGEDARNRERLARILDTPEMHRAIEDVTRTATAELSKELAKGVRKELAPAVVAGVVDSMRTELSQNDRRAIADAVASLAAGSTRAVLRSAADEIPETVAPAMSRALTQELQDRELRDALTGLVSEMTRQALISARDAIAEAQVQNEATGRVGVLQQVRRGLTLSWFLAFGLGFAAVFVLAYSLRLRRRTKRFRSALVETLSQQQKHDGHADESDAARVQRLVELLQ